ncbi:MAG: class I SAM-dependent methyltransferase [Elusimicrobia bacterium]|nr:class I SAM-dependent methyltransferase [Elusimicrobiota bacterium]
MKELLKSGFERMGLLGALRKVKRRSLVWADHLIHGPLFKKRLADVVGDRAAILDIGFGHYETMAKPYLAARAKSYVGVDSNPEYVANAKAAIDLGFLPDKCQFINRPIEECAFPEQSFDVIFSSSALVLIPTYAEVIRNCANWISPQGRLILCLGARHPSKKNNAILRAAFRCLHPFAKPAEVLEGVNGWLDWNRKGARDGQFGHLPGKRMIQEDAILTEVEKFFFLSDSFGCRPFIDIITKDLNELRLLGAVLVKPIDFILNITGLMDPTYFTYVFRPKLPKPAHTIPFP